MNFSSYENCKCKVSVKLIGSNYEDFGFAGYSKSGDICYVWFDDSSCDKFVLVDGFWKIPSMSNYFYEIKRI